MDINGLQILFQVINFGVVFAALTYFLQKPVLKMLDDRRQKTEDAARAAEETLREREQVEVMKKKAKAQAEKDADKVVEDAKAEAKDLKATLAKSAKEEIADTRKKELAKLDLEKKAHLEKTEKEVAKLSIAIAEKVLGDSIDEKKHKSLIAASLKDLAKAL